MIEEKNTPSPAMTSPSRLEYIDSLRGLSALLVVFSHAFVFLTLNDYFINIGKVGVFIFFMIRGFFIPYSFKKTKGSYKIFLTTRFFRLYPAYWLSIIFALIVYATVDPSIPGKLEILSNVTMFQMGMGQKNIIGVYWTLFIELIFYIICVGLAMFNSLWNEKRMIMMFYIVILFSILTSLARFFLHKKLPVAIPLGLSMMFFGYAWRECIINKSAFALSKIKGMAITCILTTFVCGYLSYSWDRQAGEPWQNFSYAYTISLFIFIFMTTYIKVYNKYICYIGIASYSLYLIHDPMIHLLSSILPVTFNIQMTLIKLISIASSLLFSAIVYNVIEKPGISIGRRIISNIKKSQA